MTEPTSVDVAVIGLGSAGENLATRLAESGRSVVGFEPGFVGGECPFEACIPSKVLLHHVRVESDWTTALAHRQEATGHLDDTEHADQLTAAGVTVVRAPARLTGEKTVTADGLTWRADQVVIATGGKAVIPDVVGTNEHPRLWTSDRYLTTDALPDSMIVLGGGAIGCELSTVHNHFAGATTLIDHSSLFGDDVDAEVAETVAAQLRAAGVDVRTDASVSTVSWTADSVAVSFDDGTSIAADALLVATGKRPRWDRLGLDTVGIDDPAVDDDLRIRGLDWLYAIGDVNGVAPWTHGANHQARWLADRLTGNAWPDGRMRDIPHCVFTVPPVGAVGHTASSARNAGHDPALGTATYADVARGSTDRLDDGLVVVVVDRSTRRLLGCSGTGERFDEIISTFSAWLHAGWTVDQAIRTVIPFPTLTEVLTPALESAAQAIADG